MDSDALAPKYVCEPVKMCWLVPQPVHEYERCSLFHPHSLQTRRIVETKPVSRSFNGHAVQKALDIGAADFEN